MADAKEQLAIAADDTAHDDELLEAIEAAREQFELDTQYVTVPQTFEVLMDQWPDSREVVLPVRPVTSLTSVTYTDGSNDSVTLSTTIADLDRKKRSLALKYDQTWPTVATQKDCIVITVVAGYVSGSLPRLIKRALKLQVGKWFEDRDMMHRQTEQDFDLAYERVIRRLLRESYP